MFLVLLVLFWAVIYWMSRFFSRERPDGDASQAGQRFRRIAYPLGQRRLDTGPREQPRKRPQHPAVLIELPDVAPDPVWSALDDTQLTRLLKSAAP